MLSNYPNTCRGCIVNWDRRQYNRLQEQFHAGQPKEKSRKKRLSKDQIKIILSKYVLVGET